MSLAGDEGWWVVVLGSVVVMEEAIMGRWWDVDGGLLTVGR